MHAFNDFILYTLMNIQFTISMVMYPIVCCYYSWIAAHVYSHVENKLNIETQSNKILILAFLGFFCIVRIKRNMLAITIFATFVSLLVDESYSTKIHAAVCTRKGEGHIQTNAHARANKSYLAGNYYIYNTSIRLSLLPLKIQHVSV